MIARECDIFLFRRNKGVKRLFTFRRWMLLFPLTLILLSFALNAVLWRYYKDIPPLAAKTAQQEKLLAEQKAESLRCRQELFAMESEVARIGSFNRKLGEMISFDPAKDAGLSGPGAAHSGLSYQAGAFPGRFSLTRRMNSFLARLGGDISVQEVLQQKLRNSLRDKKLEFEARPSLWPMKGYITSGYGYRRSPFGRGADFHTGVDIKAPYGSPIHAPGAGRVVKVGYMNGYGLRVVIAHDYGISTVYAHLKRSKVKEGQFVKRGQLIALSGNSGRTTGTHLHYEVRINGKTVDPKKFMLE